MIFLNSSDLPMILCFSCISRAISEGLTLSVAIPNLIGLYMLSGLIRREYKKYVTRLQNGEFEKIK